MLLELITDPPAFLILAILGGIGVALISAPLGVFMVWQKQSYFGATLAHSALLGISLGLFLELNLTFSVIITSVTIALIIYFIQDKINLSADTLLGLLAHSALALGLVILSLQTNVQIDFMGYLFGDILSINETDLMLIAALGVLVAVFFKLHWQDLLNITINPELASVEGVKTKRVQLTYVLLLALMIALAMKIVGVLLVTSLLIIPAAAARRLSRTPEQMLGFTLLLGVASVLLGILASILWDIPTGPSIVVAASLFFILLRKRSI